MRHCGDCKKNVFDLSAMTESEAAALVAGNLKGELCVKFYRRQDGTVMTSDCGAVPESSGRPPARSLPRLVGAAVLALSAAGCSPREAAPKENVVTVALDMVAPESQLMVGMMIMDEVPKPPTARKVPRTHAPGRKAEAPQAVPDEVEPAPTSEPCLTRKSTRMPSRPIGTLAPAPIPAPTRKPRPSASWPCGALGVETMVMIGAGAMLAAFRVALLRTTVMPVLPPMPEILSTKRTPFAWLGRFTLYGCGDIHPRL
ncbi:hypothetical protein BN2497_2499 [Janthinobacterium sp. CG23_2]|nr:hypothetical protein BN2497_2499 [Janthinobacterium sp. CG23_2]CUU27647.1 hypothetical protein BN3177_2499 [Janthinobacterium sp. CG23_2]